VPRAPCVPLLAAAVFALGNAPAQAAGLRLDAAPRGRVSVRLVGATPRAPHVFVLDGRSVLRTRARVALLAVGRPTARVVRARWRRLEVRRADSGRTTARARFAMAASTTARAPTLLLLTAPSGTITATTAEIGFSASGGATSCRLDRGSFRPCSGSMRYAGLAPGAHSVTVRAANRAGTAAVRESWSVGSGLTGPGAADPPAAPALQPAVATPLGWREVFRDDFSGTALDAGKWGTYSGQPGGVPGGWWDPSHVVVGGGVAALRGYRDPNFGGRWVTGGMSSGRGLKQTYGKYLVRFRVDAGYGISPILLLWPTAEHWPPEIDFAEDGGAGTTRDHMTATMHYGATNDQIQRTVYADFTQWHTMGVEWLPGRLTYTLDGQPWAGVTTSAVPAEPMELDLQTQAGTGDPWSPAPDASTPPEVDMQIDWVVAYAPA
jgi:hypothetical protein